MGSSRNDSILVLLTPFASELVGGTRSSPDTVKDNITTKEGLDLVVQTTSLLFR